MLNLLKEHKYVSVNKLANILNYSKSTIRRDLTNLSKIKLVQRTPGGAILIRDQYTEDPLDVRQYANANKKKIIADLAIDYIENYASVFLDSSSTCFFLAKKLKQKKHVVIVTPNLITVSYLELNTDNSVYCIGGKVTDQRSGGPESEMATQNYFVDIMFFSCRGIDDSLGVSDRVETEASIKRAMSKQAKKVVLLVDSTKFDNHFLFKSIEMANIDVIISDKKPDKLFCENLLKENHHMEIIYPDTN
ncbi:DeoR/GlpR family DNA-binding transcription regulator [Loigolactobacillus zhaoyuanensis]|uniref:DeoR/GlpR family DNA-binding transcription regulator n=1 Tax=Loigolactobacillus zhaoyuanensis TaxID=2486017 RepID=A0ABW8UB02_9LACO